MTTSSIRIAYRGLVTALCLCVLAGCQSTAPEPDWPETISYHRLDLTNQEAVIQQSYALPDDKLIRRLAGSTTIHKQYNIKGPTGHGLFGTDVYYDTANNQFYLRSDCGQGHYDGYLGPFEGDPRIVLRQEDLPEQAIDKPDPYVGHYTAFYHWSPLLIEAEAFYLERNEYEFPLLIARQGSHYLISIESNLRLVDRGDKGLLPAEGSMSKVVRSLHRDVEMEGIDALFLRDDTFARGFLLVPGVGPDRYRAADPERQAKLEKGWAYKRNKIDVGRSRGGFIGELSYKGKPVTPTPDTVRPGSLIITPIGKFMYFGPPPPDTETYIYLSGWLAADHRSNPFFDDNGSLTSRGLARRFELKRKPWPIKP